MPQLIMRWKNDGAKVEKPVVPAGLELRNYVDVDDATNEWLDIICCGISKKREDEAYFQRKMIEWPCFEKDNCFFVFVDGKAAATITVICNNETKQGYIHMVACKEEYRGRGIGTFMNKVAVYELKRKGMETAYLTTDDFRIPAIKSYLRAGFYADESTEDFVERWKAIREKIGQ